MVRGRCSDHLIVLGAEWPSERVHCHGGNALRIAGFAHVAWFKWWAPWGVDVWLAFV